MRVFLNLHLDKYTLKFRQWSGPSSCRPCLSILLHKIFSCSKSSWLSHGSYGHHTVVYVLLSMFLIPISGWEILEPVCSIQMPNSIHNTFKICFWRYCMQSWYAQNDLYVCIFWKLLIHFINKHCSEALLVAFECLLSSGNSTIIKCNSASSLCNF